MTYLIKFVGKGVFMEYRKISLEELDKLKNLYAYENFEEFKKLIINDISNGIKNIFVIEENKNLIGEITVTIVIKIFNGVKSASDNFKVTKKY